jgi:PST family polysaccharide transporter
MGGAQFIIYMIGILKIKIAALYLGVEGVGIVGTYVTFILILTTIFSAGIPGSAVRKIAMHLDNPSYISRVVTVTYYFCLIAGIIVVLLIALFSKTLSSYLFVDTQRVFLFLIGFSVLFNILSLSKMAYMQGMRNIRLLALSSVISNFFGTVIAITCYVFWGANSIEFSLLAGSLSTYSIQLFLTKTFKPSLYSINLKEFRETSLDLSKLGFALMWSALLVAGLEFGIKIYLNHSYGVSYAGYYHAAWSLSILFSTFILKAMGTDYYPRLAESINDNKLASNIVNQQTELAVLLALPGLVLTLLFSNVAIEFFYSKDFLAASPMLVWFSLAVFVKIITWPLGYIQLAKGESLLFFSTETLIIVLQAALVWLMVTEFGMLGIAFSVFLSQLLYLLLMIYVSKQLIDFKWSKDVLLLIVVSSFFIILSLFSKESASNSMFSLLILGCVLFYSVFTLNKRVNLISSISLKIKNKFI